MLVADAQQVFDSVPLTGLARALLVLSGQTWKLHANIVLMALYVTAPNEVVLLLIDVVHVKVEQAVALAVPSVRVH